MTAGMDALREAARLETARVYGALQREHHSDECAAVDEVVDRPAVSVIRLAPPRKDVA